MILAMLRASWLVAASYRLQTVISLVGLLFTVVPIYYIANGIEPLMKGSISDQGGQFFAFVLLGGVALNFVTTGLSALPNAVGGSIGGGTLEVLLGAPAPLPAVFAGLTSYDLMMTSIRSLLMLIAGAAFGAPILWSHLPLAVLVLCVIVLAYLPFALVATALRIAFRTSGPLVSAIVLVSTLLGGVYYPPSKLPRAVPYWVRGLADYVPLTSGLRAFRRVLLEGVGPLETLRDLAPLLVAAPIAIALGALCVRWSLAYARRAGTLSQA